MRSLRSSIKVKKMEGEEYEAASAEIRSEKVLRVGQSKKRDRDRDLK